MDLTDQQYLDIVDHAHTEARKGLATQLVGKTEAEMDTILEHALKSVVRSVASEVSGGRA